VPLPLEDYALLGDTQTAALVGRNGSVDWLCMPRFDSPSCFAALLGGPEHGRWLLAPAAGGRAACRRYRGDSLILESEFETDEGAVRIIDFMPPRGVAPDVIRIVEGLRGRVPMHMQLVIRFDYGHIVPWVRRLDGTLSAVGGPDALCLRTPVETHGETFTTVAEFSVSEGDRVPFVLTWYPSHERVPDEVPAEDALTDTASFWDTWMSDCSYEGEWGDALRRSLVVLKALTYAPTGGIVAAPTTSLPEWIGGVRNWDYRFCWLRDATLTLNALLVAGYVDEARRWRDWLLRTVAGDPADLQALYGTGGERRTPEWEVPWLPGYEGSGPVRIGNAASEQLQIDVYGEVIDALHQARRAGLEPDPWAWALQRKLLEYLEEAWRQPDEGIWEVRGPRRHFVHSKVMAWAAFDRAVEATERLGLPGDGERWKRLRAEVHAEVLREGYDAERNTFVQSYGSDIVDASLLLIPLVGFLPAGDPRVAGTVEAVQRELCEGGFVLRYPVDEDVAEVDGLPPGEGAFLPCTFWLADCLAALGREDEARATFEHLLSLRNDVGLLSEEYDVERGRLVGNFPQAFSHLGLVGTAYNLAKAGGAKPGKGQATSSPQT
jgi:GH15 family glucan-1,4-alpha-glucosidase